MRVRDVEVISPCLYLAGGHLPRAVRFYSTIALRSTPPVNTRLEVLDPDRPGHRVSLLPLGYSMLVEPDLTCGPPLFEEQEVSPDGGIGLEYAVLKPNDGVKVELLK